MSTQITCQPLEECPVCGTIGSGLYKHLTDELFHVEGTYSLSKCTNKLCGSLWVNPAPVKSDLPKLYKSYSTHKQPVLNTQSLKNFRQKLKAAVVSNELNYPTLSHPFLNSLLNIISYLHPSWRDATLANLFYMPYVKDGTLLDIGCGNGSSMLVMQSLGWKVSGIDFDVKAIHMAKCAGLNASVSDLFEKKFPDNSFDAIMMNHVIEHLHEPSVYLKECLRILKPGGVFIALTPNADSLGHKLYKSSWRGLEVPRHLQIFTPQSLSLLASKVGFVEPCGFTSTQGIIQIFEESKIRHRTGKFNVSHPSSTNKFYKIKLFTAGLRHKLLPRLSEVAVLRCKKNY